MSLVLNGTSQNLNIQPAITAALTLGYPCTYACWYKPNNNTAQQVLINGSNTGTFPNDRSSLETNSGLLIAYVQNSSFAGGGPASQIPVTIGAWNHCVAVFTSRTTRSVYLNGVFATDSGADVGGTGAVAVSSIGSNYHGGLSSPRNFANGSIAFPAIWGMTLTAFDVAALYNAGTGADPRTVEPQKLLSLLLLSGGTPYLDLVSGLTWSSLGSPTTGADPFALTAAGSPTLTVGAATNVTSTTAVFNGQMVFTRGANPTIEGFNYGTSTAYGSQVTQSGSFSPSNYSLTVTGLTPATIYYYQAFATNVNGTGTSTFNSFFTTPQAGLYPGTVVPDIRMGVATHFDQQGSSPWYNPTLLLPLIVNSGCTWIRDDFNHLQTEIVQGVYIPSGVKGFWAQAKALGLHTSGILKGTTAYTSGDVYDPAGMANYCAWVATTLSAQFDVLEVLNEPNNAYHGTEGPTWEDQLVVLTNAIYAAVKAVNPSQAIIGFGAQGHQILEMLAEGGTVDGVVYHPYDLNNNIPETNYEPPYLDYIQWVTTLRSITNLPRWETEFSASNVPTAGEYYGAIWLARRLLLSWFYDSYRTFYYDFADPVTSQSLYDTNQHPRQARYVLQRFLLAVSGLATTGIGITISNTSPGFDIPDFLSAVFANATTTTAAVWFGNNIVNQIITGTADLTFNLLNTNASSWVVDMITGFSSNLSVYTTFQTGTSFTIRNFPISNIPKLITITGVPVANVPLVIGWSMASVTMTTATLNGQITHNGGSSSTVTGFRYGPTTSYGTTVPTNQTISTGAINPANLTGLSPGTTYHFQVFATNATGTGLSSDGTFTTVQANGPPTVDPPFATGIGSNSATLNGNISFDGGGPSSTTGFNYGTTTAYGAQISSSVPVDTGAFSNLISGLLSTTYHFQAFATNLYGTGFSLDATFTPVAPVTGGTPTTPVTVPSTPIPAGLFPIEASDIGTSLTLYNASLLDYCNPAVKKDQAFVAICNALDPQLRSFLDEIPNAIILSNLSNQPEDVLDFLALYHFNVDYYDTTLPKAKKLLLIQNVIQDKISKGTPQRIIDLMNEVFSFGELIEWFNDNPTGPPNTFRIQIADPLTDPTTVANLFRAILSAKNVRSYFGGISSFQSASFQNWLTVGAAEYDYQILTWPRN